MFVIIMLPPPVLCHRKGRGGFLPVVSGRVVCMQEVKCSVLGDVLLVVVKCGGRFGSGECEGYVVQGA